MDVIRAQLIEQLAAAEAASDAAVAERDEARKLARMGFHEKHAALAAQRDAALARAERLEAALRAQIGAHQMLCRAAGLDDQAHRDGTAQARAALADPVTSG